MNTVRGEVLLKIADETYTLCLTLGALAEIESHFGLGNLAELDACLATPKIRDLIAILGALIRGGGHTCSDDALAKLPIHVTDASRAISEAFACAGLGADAQTQHNA